MPTGHTGNSLPDPIRAGAIGLQAVTKSSLPADLGGGVRSELADLPRLYRWWR